MLTQNDQLNPEGYSRILDVCRLAGGVSRSTIWRWVREGRFPKPCRLGPQHTAWKNSQLLDWLRSRPVADPERDLAARRKTT